MKKSPKARSVAATALLAGASCMGAGCASASQHFRSRPPPAECPPGAEASHARLGIMGASHGIYFPPIGPTASVPEGNVTALLVGPWGTQLKDDGPVSGQFFFVKGHVYGRFTQVQLPSGEIVPVCMQILTSKGLGIAMEPGSTSKRAIIKNILSVETVDKFQ